MAGTSLSDDISLAHTWKTWVIGDMSHPLARVLGSGITPLGVMRCLGPEGIRVWQVSQAPQMERYSRYVQLHYPRPENAPSVSGAFGAR